MNPQPGLENAGEPSPLHGGEAVPLSNTVAVTLPGGFEVREARCLDKRANQVKKSASA